jgi:hypothetical protein
VGRTGGNRAMLGAMGRRTSAGRAPSPRFNSRLALLVSVPVLVALLWLQGMQAGRRFIDPDELEHLNAAYFTTRGETLYGSFFENHPPLTTVLLQPVVRSSDVPAELIARGRWMMLALSACVLAGAARLAWMVGGRSAAVVAATLLLAHPFYFDKMMEVRPDVPALLLVVAGFHLLLRASSSGRPSAALAAGATLCAAGLFTPKVIFVAFGATVATVVTSGRRAEAARVRAALRTFAWIVAGAAAVSGIAAGVLAWYGVLGGFMADVIGLSVRMRIDDVAFFRGYYLREAMTDGWATWVLAAIGAVAFRAQRVGPPGLAQILCWSVAAGLIGVFVTTVPLRQFFLMFVPPLAVLAACGVTLLGRWFAMRQVPFVAEVITAALMLFATVPAIRAAVAPQRTIDSQLRTINAVVSVTTPEDRVLDTSQGLYLTRLPAYRYFYLNPDVVRLLEPAELTRGLLAALQNPRVKVAFVDDALPGPVAEFVRESFALIPYGAPARLRR